MTAFIVAVKTGSVELLTDAAYYDPSGIVVKVESKALPLPGRAVVSGRGSLSTLWCYRDIVHEWGCASFDEVLAAHPDISAEVRRLGVPVLGDRYDEHEILLAGWSESRDCGEAWLAPGHDLFANQPRGQLSDAGLFFVAGPNPWEVPGIVRDLAALEAFDAAVDGLAMMEWMRRQPEHISAFDPASPIIHGVGGFCELTTITRDGVERRTLREWPDKVGELIAPVS